MSQLINHHPASFRDPSGFIYEKDGTIYRFVSDNYSQDYDLLMKSGLADDLLKKKLLLPFTDLSENHTGRSDWYKTLQPQQLPFLSYAWEWSFEQLKDAALTTLNICRQALHKGMILKDATPSNIQLVDGKYKLIDTLSFETYIEGESWIAYRQFCECFLNPLLIAVYTGMEVHKLILSYPDGVPAAVTSKLLPFKTKLNASVYLHVHLQAKMAGKQSTEQKQTTRKITKKNIEQILENLHSCISNLLLPSQSTTWNNYYSETILSESYFLEKKKLVSSILGSIEYSSVLDLGANEGEFSLLCKNEAMVISTDFDSDCINRFYKRIKEEKRTNIYPSVIDLTYPSPSMGWMNEERPAFFSRTKVDVCMALALIHHLAIAKNITFEQLAAFLASVCKVLIIEFVPKSDPKVAVMLQWRKDIFNNYDEETFEEAFAKLFELEKKMNAQGSERTMYVYRKK
ncbi:SAM-dependent methyltransferase [Lacibacter sediminis]|uniref:SAM-dependent methyltransferase n=1 Tax=Lacibacter sediminis TaxID=2760713 RepID=A0A7G5XJ46_9BACT|nr:SAM-dependent methyltransferase [Lacibacter sediminis]QNA45499.1 SAM-dependent methyltransferase [Lacibacter sediminis]